MEYRQRLGLLIINMTTICFIVVSLGILSCYRLSIAQQKRNLQKIIDNRAAFITAIINQEGINNLSLVQQEEKTLELLQNANNYLKLSSQREEFTLAKRENNQIIFLLSSSYQEREKPIFIEWESKLAIPTQTALKGESGTVVDLDYRGVKVLAAYQPIDYFNWALVAKTDLTEIRSPFIKIIIYTGIIGIIINLGGIALLKKLTYPLVQELEDTKSNNRNLEKKLKEAIFERSNIEKALQQEIAILAKIMDMNQVGIILFNPEGKIILASGKAESILGLSADKISQLSVDNIFLEVKDNDCKAISENEIIFYQVLSSKQSIYDEICTITIEQIGQKFLSINAAPIIDDEGNIQGVLYAFEDVTIQLKNQQELYQRESQFRAIFENAALGIALLDLEGKIIKANYSLQKMLGYSEIELNNFNFYNLSYSDSSTNNVDSSDLINNQENNAYQVERRYLCQNGDIVWANLTVSWVKDADNKPLFMVAMLENITKRKQSELALQESERKYRNMIETAHEGVWIIDNDYTTTFVNQRIAEMLGYNEEEILGKKLWEFTDLEGKNVFLNKLNERHQGIQEQNDFKFIHKDGREIWTLVATNPIFDSLGNCTGLLGLISDITEHKRIEKQLQKANANLQNSVITLQAHNKETELLNKINEFIQACLSIDEAYVVLGDLLSPLFPECSGAIFIINESNSLVEAVSIWGDKSSTETIFFPSDCWALRHGYVHLSNKVYHSLFCKHINCESLPNMSLCLPMIAQNKYIGMFYLASQNEHSLNEHKQKFARTVAENLSLNLANLQLRESLHQNSIRDSLTGLFNRRYLEESLRRELCLAQRKKHNVGVMMIDIDHFKTFNDTFGHDAGDMVLREVGQILKNEVRGSDIACRYGGEELTIIMPEANIEKTFDRAEKIRNQINKLTIKYNNKLLGKITASFGVANFPEHGKTIEKVLQNADEALYHAKKQGRNQTIIFQDE